jgi:surface antigen
MKFFAIILSMTVMLCGCDPNTMNKQQWGSLLGGGGGAALGGLIGSHASHGKAGMTLMGAGLGGIIGYLAGSTIGQHLDERDRQSASTATMKVLNQPIRKNSNGTGSAHPVKWVSDHNQGTSGSSNVIEVEPNPGSGGECRTVREVAYIKGQEVMQESKYCHNAEGQWVPAA